MPENKNSKAGWLVFLCGSILALVFLEVILRAGGVFFAVSQKRADRESGQGAKALRILCLGESMTAMGGKDSYPQQLQEILSQRLSPAKVRVINKGAVWTNSAFILLHLNEYLDVYLPDLVVVMTGINDQFSKYYEGIPGAGARLFRSIHLYRFLSVIAAKSWERSQMALMYYLGGDQGCNRLGWELLDRNKLFEAEEMFRRAVFLNPQNQWAQCGLGYLYRLIGDYPQSQEHLLKALEINPRNVLACTFLGWTLKLSERPEQSAKMLERALALKPDDYNAGTLLGWVYFEQGRFPEAEKVLKEIIRFHPRQEDPYFKLAQLYVAQQKLDLAAAVLEQGLASLPVRKGKIYGTLATIYQRQGKQELAAAFAFKAGQAAKEEPNAATAQNLSAVYRLLAQRGILLICVQYPMRPVDTLKTIFPDGQKGICFVDNEQSFKAAVRRDGFRTYFFDLFAGDFGHCTARGNRLLAANIADTIIKEHIKTARGQR